MFFQDFHANLRIEVDVRLESEKTVMVTLENILCSPLFDSACAAFFSQSLCEAVGGQGTDADCTSLRRSRQGRGSLSDFQEVAKTRPPFPAHGK